MQGVHARLAASNFDTSVKIIETHYTKNITSYGDDLMRK